MSTSTAKQDALNAIQILPESVSLDDIMYQLYVLQKVQAGEKSAQSEATLTIDSLRADMRGW